MGELTTASSRDKITTLNNLVVVEEVNSHQLQCEIDERNNNQDILKSMTLSNSSLIETTSTTTITTRQTKIYNKTTKQLSSSIVESSSSSSSSSSITSTQLKSTSMPSISSSSTSTLISSALKFTPTMNFYKRIAVSFLVILEVLLVPVYAGPVNVRHHRMLRDTYTDLENNRATVPSQNETQQDDTCLLDGIITKRATIHCETKPGCKAIQKTGYCCPEYQCECEKDGKIYSNGDILPDEFDTPCKVYFCKGGEIVCTYKTCYTRGDCEPKYIPGKCCPEYDNCPPLLENVETTGNYHSINSSDTTDNSVQKLDQTSAASSNKHHHEMPLNNPLNITIKEITKVEEIRITDAPPVNGGVPKSKPLIILQSQHTTASPLTTTHLTSSQQKDSQQQSLNSIEGKTLEDEIISPAAVGISSSSSSSASSTGDAQLLNTENTKLTLVETKTILFPATDISPYHNDKISTTAATSIPLYNSPIFGTTETNKVVISDNNLLSGEESIKIVRHANVPAHSDRGENNFIQAADDKERNHFEINNEQAGDQVVIIDKNGQSKPITVFGIKGLQRGDVIEDPSLSAGSNRVDDNNTSGRRKDKTKGSSESSKEYDSIENSDIDPIQASSSDDFVRVVIGSSTESINEISDSNENYNATKIAAGEEEIYEPVLYEEVLDSSSVSPLMSSSTEEIFDPIHYTPEPEAGENQLNETSEEPQAYDPVFHPIEEEKIYEPVYHNLENDTISTSGAENVSSEPFPFIETEDEGDINPAYPKIKEDDLSIHRQINGPADYLESGNTETKSLVHNSVTQIKEEPRSVIDSPTVLSAELRLDSTTESQNIFDLTNSSMANDTIINDIIAAHPEPRVPGEPCLVPEWERINGTGESRCNNTIVLDSSIEDYGMMGLTLLKGNDTWPTSSEVDIEFGSGSGMGSSAIDLGYSSSNLIDNREPTTPKTKNNIDIDEIDGGGGSSGGGSSGNSTTSLGNDPKDDAESLKLDENDNDKSSASGVGINGAGVAEEINRKSAKSFYGFDSFMFF